MSEFFADDYLEQVYDYAEENMEITEWEDFVREYLKNADDTKVYCVAEIYSMSVEVETDYETFTQAAYLLDRYFTYKDGGYDYLVETTVSNSDAKNYDELIAGLDNDMFSFESYLKDSLFSGEQQFLVKDSFTINLYDEKTIDKWIEEYKDKTQINHDLKSVAAELYGEAEADRILKTAKR